MRIALVVLAATLPLWAGEQAVLRNGFRLAVERHEVTGETVRLYTSTGVIEMARSQVAQFEAEEAAAAPVRQDATATPPPDAAEPRAALPTRDPKVLLDRAADKYGVPAALLHSVARAESAYRVDAISPKGAIGVMQLMPATASELGANPHDVEQNIDAGARYLRDLLVQYEGSAHKALSAYNAGPQAVKKYNGVPPYAETVHYIDRVLGTYQRLAAASR
ncbi:MAG: lytic transglycosylase domain-containing protein [Bryobacterales bacterium]|nr:lytic transglycosylase domain-containing protein [Bryobacterales bacterium]